MSDPDRQTWDEFYAELYAPEKPNGKRPFQLPHILKTATKKMNTQRQINLRLFKENEALTLENTRLKKRK